MKTSKILYGALFALTYGAALSVALVGCEEDLSDPSATVAASGNGVQGLQASIEGRKVTMTWTTPAGAAIDHIVVYNANDQSEYYELKPDETQFVINKADTEVELTYCVKIIYEDLTASAAQTVKFTVAKPAEEPVALKKVAFLSEFAKPEDVQDDDEKAAAEWFKKTYMDKGTGDWLTTSGITNGISAADYGAVWVMVDRVGEEKGFDNLPQAYVGCKELLENYVKEGGNLLLTNMATQIATGIGRIDAAPGTFGSGDGANNNDTWGLNVVIGNKEGETYDHNDHPAFEGIRQEEYTYGHQVIGLQSAGWHEDHNCMWDLNAVSGLEENPNKVADFENKYGCTVLGTWQHVVDYCCAGMVEFKPKGDWKGTVMVIGVAAYEWHMNQGANSCQKNVEGLTENSLNYLNGLASAPKVAKKVAFLSEFANPEAVQDDDEKAAAEWFKKTYMDAGTGDWLTTSGITNGISAADYGAVWVMVDRVGQTQGFENLPQAYVGCKELLENYVKEGGNLLLTNMATQIATGIGRIDAAPTVYGNGAGGDNPDDWGMNVQIGLGGPADQQYDHRDHKVFADLKYISHTEGEKTYDVLAMIGSGKKEDHNCFWDMNVVSGLVDNPNKVADFENKYGCTVLGTWQQVLDYCCAGMVEFKPQGEWKGTVMAIGVAAYEWNIGSNRYQKNIEGLTENCIEYLR